MRASSTSSWQCGRLYLPPGLMGCQGCDQQPHNRGHRENACPRVQTLCTGPDGCSFSWILLPETTKPPRVRFLSMLLQRGIFRKSMPTSSPWGHTQTRRRPAVQCSLECHQPTAEKPRRIHLPGVAKGPTRSVRKRPQQDLCNSLRASDDVTRFQGLAVRAVHQRLPRVPKQSVSLSHQARPQDNNHPSGVSCGHLKYCYHEYYPGRGHMPHDAWHSWLTDKVQGEPKFDDNQAGQRIDTETNDVVDHHRAWQRLQRLMELESNTGTSTYVRGWSGIFGTLQQGAEISTSAGTPWQFALSCRHSAFR